MLLSLSDLDSGADTLILLRSYSFTDLLWILLCYRYINILTDVLTGSFIVLSCNEDANVVLLFICMLCYTNPDWDNFVYVYSLCVLCWCCFMLHIHFIFPCSDLLAYVSFCWTHSTYWDSVDLICESGLKFCWFLLLAPVSLVLLNSVWRGSLFCYTSINHHPNAKILL